VIPSTEFCILSGPLGESRDVISRAPSETSYTVQNPDSLHPIVKGPEMSARAWVLSVEDRQRLIKAAFEGLH
jgi:hypothetical protein